MTEQMTEETYRLYTDYVSAGAYCLKTRNGFRIPALVLDQWNEQGFAILRTNTLAEKYGVGRKTMWNTIRGAIDNGFIKEVGRTEEGRSMYVPCLERGIEWRAGREAQV